MIHSVYIFGAAGGGALRVRLPKYRGKGRSVVIARLRPATACLPPRVLLVQHTRDAIGICSRWSQNPIAGRHAGAPTNGITTSLPKPPAHERSPGSAVAPKGAFFSIG